MDSRAGQLDIKSVWTHQNGERMSAVTKPSKNVHKRGFPVIDTYKRVTGFPRIHYIVIRMTMALKL